MTYTVEAVDRDGCWNPVVVVDDYLTAMFAANTLIARFDGAARVVRSDGRVVWLAVTV